MNVLRPVVRMRIMDHAVASSALRVAKWVLIQNPQLTGFLAFQKTYLYP